MQNENNSRTLTRGKSGIIAGVCSGLADFYGFRTNGLRLAFLLAITFFGLPIFVYFALWLILPRYPLFQSMAQQARRKAFERQTNGR